jgi:hypothetical protein
MAHSILQVAVRAIDCEVGLKVDLARVERSAASGRHYVYQCCSVANSTASARNKGTCANRLNIRRDELEPRILYALQHRLMDPMLFKEFCDEFTLEMNRLRMEGRAALVAQREEQEHIQRELDGAIQAVLDGVPRCPD